MEFTLDPAELERARNLVARIAEDLVAESRSLDRSVSGLLGGGWTGAAAEEYRQAWSDWREGADEVLAALRTTSELMAQTRAAYLASDETSVQTTSSISARLQERLS